MKNLHSLFFLLAIILVNSIAPVNDTSAQTLDDDGNVHTINANGVNIYDGSAQDYTIPSSTSYNRITFTLKGGDGGDAKAGADCQSNGGEGATTVVDFRVGAGTNELAYGSTVRFIVGKHGEKNETGGSNYATGGGGGGTAVLYRASNSDPWIILAAAGGGGGAHQGNILGACIDNQKGQGGRATENGGNGEGSNSGSGGTNGNGGTDGVNPINNGFSGGGAYSNGSPSGGGQGFANGGQGSQALASGGFGFGGGGASAVTGAGGAGGYSGGGGGGDHDNGGGGGSYANPTFALSSSITQGVTGGGSLQNGYVEYHFAVDPVTWTGAVNNNWNNSANWSPARIPNSSDYVYIHAAANSPKITSATTANARVVKVFTEGNLTIDIGCELNLYPISTNGILNEGTIDNTGEIRITRYNGHPNLNGIENVGGSIINRLAAIININGTDQYGILNSANASFVNQNGGTVIIGSASNPIGDSGIRNLDGSSITNFGNLNIRNTEGNAVENKGTFSNSTTATLTINQTTTDAIQCQTGGFTNSGQIRIGELAAIGDDAIQLNSTAAFQNNATGSLSIWQSTDYGIFVSPNSTFENSGALVIGGLGGVGTQGNAGIAVLGFFYNYQSGELFVDQTALVGVHNEAPGVINNEGAITVGSISPTGLDGIQNKSTFNNFPTGVINIVETGANGIYNVDNSFANTGLIKIGENGAINMQAIQNGAAGYNPVFLNNSCSAAIHIFAKNILDQANSFSNSGTIIKESVDNSNIETNTGMILHNAGTFTADNGDLPVFISGIISGRKIWTSCAGNGWANAQNWYPGGTPDSLDQVTIYPVGTTPLIPGAVAAKAKYVYVEDGAGLTNNGSLIMTNGDFKIEPEATVQGNGQYILNGNFTVTGGAFVPGTSTVTMSGNALKGIGNDSINFYNLIIDKSEDQTIGIFSDVTVTNNLTINSGNLRIYGFSFGSLTCPHLYLPPGSYLDNQHKLTLTTGALWIQSGANVEGQGEYFIAGSLAIEAGGTFTPETSTVTMNGTGIAGISPAPITFYNLVIDKPSNAKVYLLDVTVTNELIVTSGDLDLDQGFSLVCPGINLGNGSDLFNDGTVSLTNGDLRIESGAAVQGNGQYSITGNFTLDSGGTFTPGSSTVIFTGSETQFIGSQPANFHELVVDKPVGPKLYINPDITINNSLSILSGEVEVSVSGSLTAPSFILPATSGLINRGMITVVN